MLEPGGPLKAGRHHRSRAGQRLSAACSMTIRSKQWCCASLTGRGRQPASDLIWHEMMELVKEEADHRVGRQHGGIKAGATTLPALDSSVFAERTSIVGSIGVFGGKINVAPALEQFGIHAETFAASPEPGAAERAAFNSPLTSWDDLRPASAYAPRCRASNLRLCSSRGWYPRSADGRYEKVRSFRRGPHLERRSGVGARGLIDEIGGLSDALAAARSSVCLDADVPVSVEGGSRGLMLDSLLVSDDASDDDAAAAFERLSAAPSTRLLAEVPVEMRSVVSSFFATRLHEHVAVALPFGLFIHRTRESPRTATRRFSHFGAR